MNRLRVQMLVMMGVMTSSIAIAREFRTPLMILEENIHYPLEQVNEKNLWRINGWGGAYTRTSNQAYCSGTDKTPLTRLFFGQSCFRVVDAFADQGVGIFFNPNPFIKIQELRPQVRYDEQGLVVGLTIERKFGNRMRAGLRAETPFRKISVDNIGCENLGIGNADNLNAVRAFRLESINGSPVLERYAYRLDFLAALGDKNFPTATIEPIVKFADPVHSDHITIVDKDVTQASALNPLVAPAQGVNVLRSVTGGFPIEPWAATKDQVIAAGFVAPDGSAPADQQRGKFSPAVNYQTGGLGTDVLAQRQLFLVETYANDGATTSPEAADIKSKVESIVKTLQSDSAIDFLAERCICFGNQTTSGVGDTDIDLYLNYFVTDWWYTEGVFGVRFPTAPQVKNPRQLYLVPRGNNGHYEIKLGFNNGAAIFDWLQFNLNLSYSFVLKRCEPILASFENACVKNLGPCTNAEVKWGHFDGRFTMTVLHPQNQDLGFDMAYQLYVKQHDKIEFQDCVVNDFLCTPQQTSSCVAERITNQIGHIFRGEVFNRYKQFLFTVGASHVFAGKNIPVESDMYLKVDLEF